jgi:hypothetical protein
MLENLHEIKKSWKSFMFKKKHCVNDVNRFVRKTFTNIRSIFILVPKILGKEIKRVRIVFEISI